MLTDITHYSNETLAELHDAGLLFFGYYLEQASADPKPTATVLWNNTAWAYDQRREHKLCRLLINIEE